MKNVFLRNTLDQNWKKRPRLGTYSLAEILALALSRPAQGQCFLWHLGGGLERNAR